MKVIIQAKCHLKLLVSYCFSAIQLILHPPANTGHLVGEFMAAGVLLWVQNYSGSKIISGCFKVPFAVSCESCYIYREHCQSWPPKKLSEVLKFLAWFLSYKCDEHVLLPFTSYIYIFCTFKDAIKNDYIKKLYYSSYLPNKNTFNFTMEYFRFINNGIFLLFFYYFK